MLGPPTEGVHTLRVEYQPAAPGDDTFTQTIRVVSS
jgi:hypothetical protein